MNNLGKTPIKLLRAGLTAGLVLGLSLVCGSSQAAGQSSLSLGQSLAMSSQGFSLAPVQLLNTAALHAMDLGRWEQMTRAALMPSYGHQLGIGVELDTSLLADHEHLLVPEFAEAWAARRAATVLTFDFSSVRVPETPLLNDLGALITRPIDSVGTLDRVIFAPGVGHRFGDDSILDVAAVLATQRFSSIGLGSRVYDADSGRYVESSAGAGLRLGWTSELNERVQLTAGVQSRIDMDEFEGYRGIFFEPGDFDIPATANLGLSYAASDRLSLNLDAQRVMYSEISAVTTALLPDSILSLLGDSSSPEFVWSDLTVLRLGLGWRASQDQAWRVDLSTTQQPRPTADSLARAIEDEYDSGNVTLGMSQRTGANAWLDVRASYAPSQYLVAIAPIQPSRPDPDQELIEVELLWTLGF